MSYFHRLQLLCATLSLCIAGISLTSVEVYACQATVGQGVGLMPPVNKEVNTCWTYSCYDEFYLKDATRSGITTARYSELWNPDEWAKYEGSGMLDYFSYDNIWDHWSQANAVDAHVHAGNTYDYLLSMFGSFNNITGTNMVSWVDDPRPGVQGAAWFGWLAKYATPTSGSHPAARAIDIVAHEFGHGVTNSASRYNDISPRQTAFLLDYAGESGALQEAFSDWIGLAVKFANRTTVDWMFGRDAYTGQLYADGRQILGRRNVSDPYGENNVRCLQPDYYWGARWCTGIQASPCDCVHVNVGVPNKMFYLLAKEGQHTHKGIEVQGLGMEKAIRIAYKANMEYWPRNASFYHAMLGMIDAAAALYGGYGSNEVRQVKLAWAAVGVGNRFDVYNIGDGNGTVSRNSAYLGSGYSGSIYPTGDTVTVTATPDPYSIFTGWYREECGLIYYSSGNVTNIMPDGLNYAVEFIRPKIYANKAGSGGGTVSGPGIWCGGTCSGVYNPYTYVTLYASPDSTSYFAGWSGGGCGGTGACTVYMDWIKYVTAVFEYDWSTGG